MTLRRGGRSCAPPLSFLAIFDAGVPCAANKREQDAECVDGRDRQIEEENSDDNRQHLLHICCIETQTLFGNIYGRHAPATVMLSAPTFLFAVKLTTFSTNARHPLAAKASALPTSISRADDCRTRSSSPEIRAMNTHCTKASGDIRVSRSSG